jgi:hypothetical protein
VWLSHDPQWTGPGPYYIDITITVDPAFPRALLRLEGEDISQARSTLTVRFSDQPGEDWFLPRKIIVSALGSPTISYESYVEFNLVSSGSGYFVEDPTDPTSESFKRRYMVKDARAEDKAVVDYLIDDLKAVADDDKICGEDKA